MELFLQVLAWRTAPQVHIDGDLKPVDEDAYRVLAVGDSWVYGAEALPEEAFIEVFEALAEEATGGEVQIYNFGQSASNSSQALVKVHRNLEAVRPHLVVALTGNNNMLHDEDVVEAARILGEDPRLSGIRWLQWSRLYRLYRAEKAERAAAEAEAITPDPTVELLYGLGGEDPTGSSGLPPAPADPLPGASVAPEWDWWASFRRRDWEQLRAWIAATDPKDDSPEANGILHAWEALALAHLGRHDEAIVRATEALERGGDDAAAYEALAVVDERLDRDLRALQWRIRAASTGRLAHPWLQARARGLVLLHLEAWQPAEAWLMACERQMPGNLEVLLGLARLPTATRGAAVGEALAGGPRGKVTQLQFYEWHEVSSGMVDRMLDSLGEPADDDSAALMEGRGRAALVQARPDDARRWFAAAIAAAEAGVVEEGDPLPATTIARARAGLIGLGDLAPDAVPLDASNAAAIVALRAAAGDCEAAVRTGQAGLALGLSALAFEAAAGLCLTTEVGWSLVEQALGRGPVLDRAALVLGKPTGGLSRFVPPPSLPFWDDFRERDFEAVIAATDGAWKGLALAHLDRYAEATAVLDAAEQASDDAAVIAYGRMLLARQRGDVVGGMIQASIAATNTGGDPWVRTVARGIAYADAYEWRQAQVELLSALDAAPGYLEALEALSLVPQPLRYPAAEVALRYTPSGRVDADRWSFWYLLQGREEEARRALEWPRDYLKEGPEAEARRAIARGDVAAAEGAAADLGPEGEDARREATAAARDAYGAAMSAAEALDDRHLYCRAAARRVRAVGADVDRQEIVVMLGACPDHPEAVDAAGRIAALNGECPTVNDFARRSLETGADPSDVAEWMADCGDESWVLSFVDEETGGAPPEARAWLRNRVSPDDDNELPPPGEEVSSDLLVRQLAAMQALSRDAGADFVALTYPLPGAHHRRLRDRIVTEAPRASLTVLDLYAHFERTYDPAAWRALRTEQSHVTPEGYRVMGEQLFEHVQRSGRLPR